MKEQEKETHTHIEILIENEYLLKRISFFHTLDNKPKKQ